jgi:integrase
MARVTGSLITVQRKDGPVYFLKARDRDGRQIKKRLGPVADWPQKQAKDALRDYLTDLGRVPDRGDDSVTFRYAASAWLHYVEHDRGRAPSTVRDYRNTVHRYLLPQLGDRPLSEITVDDLERLRGDLLAALSPRTTQKTMVLLHGIFRLAGRRGWTNSNPAAEAERVTVKRRAEFAVLSPTEVQAVARATATEQDAALILVAAFTGLRIGELRALRWRDVDFANQIVHVRRSHYGKASAMEGPPKSGQARSVPLIDIAARALDGLSRRERFTGASGRVFCDPAGGTLNDGAIRTALYDALRRQTSTAIAAPASCSSSTTCATRSARWPCKRSHSQTFRRTWGTPTSARRWSTCTTRRSTLQLIALVSWSWNRTRRPFRMRCRLSIAARTRIRLRVRARNDAGTRSRHRRPSRQAG